MTDIGPRGPVHPGDSVEFRTDDPWYTRAQRWITHHKVVVASLAVALVLSGVGVVAGSYYFESVPTPDQLELPQATTVYFADGTTPMAKLGAENRTLLHYDEMNDAVLRCRGAERHDIGNRRARRGEQQSVDAHDERHRSDTRAREVDPQSAGANGPVGSIEKTKV